MSGRCLLMKGCVFRWLQDWEENLKVVLSSDNSSPYFQDLYQGTEVYDGELDQFKAVTDGAEVRLSRMNSPAPLFNSLHALRHLTW